MLSRVAETRNPISFDYAIEISGRDILWRHDVDTSTRAAIEIARIDAEMGVSATFFANLRSDTYNLQSAYGRQFLSELLGLGHHVGIHLDSEYYGHFETSEELETCLSLEATTFQNLIGVRPTSFSFHNPSPREITFDADKYADMVNCYSKHLQSTCLYVSDSNGFWRSSPVSELLEKHPESPIHALTHPEWWAVKTLQPRERMAMAIFEEAFEQLHRYDESMKVRGRTNKSEFVSENNRLSRWLHSIETFNRIYGEEFQKR